MPQCLSICFISRKSFSRQKLSRQKFQEYSRNVPSKTVTRIPNSKFKQRSEFYFPHFLGQLQLHSCFFFVDAVRLVVECFLFLVEGFLFLKSPRFRVVFLFFGADNEDIAPPSTCPSTGLYGAPEYIVCYRFTLFCHIPTVNSLRRFASDVGFFSIDARVRFKPATDSATADTDASMLSRTAICSLEPPPKNISN